MPEAMTSADAKVDNRSTAYKAIAPKWELIAALLEGTTAMRKKGEIYLPREGIEKQKDYDARLAHSFLFPGLKDATTKLSSKPFGKAITVAPKNGMPEQLAPLEKDADREGASITSFARDWLESAMAYGHAHVLVDFPSLERPLNLAEQRAYGVRPYFCLVEAPNLIGWRYEPKVTPLTTTPVAATPESKYIDPDEGAWTLTMVRIKETRVEPVGAYGEEVVECVRVITPTTWELWKKTGGSDEFTKAEFGTNTLGKIPLVTLYLGKRTGTLMSEPPLWTLAETNLAHWQSDSDQRSAIRFGRFNIIVGRGLSDEEVKAREISVGPSAVFLTTRTPSECEISIIGSEGGGIKIGQEDVDRLELRMEMLALQPLVSTPGASTATKTAVDEAKAHAALIAWCRDLETSLERAYAFAALWADTELPTDFDVIVFSDFGLAIKAADEITALLNARVAKEITSKTYLMEVKRRGLLGDMIDVEQELAALENEEPAMTPSPFGMTPGEVPNPPGKLPPPKPGDGTEEDAAPADEAA
jgi:hypothetical protein